ncbi:MAG TPA: hypothetical protein VGN00_16340 [Puia sp.]|jgi:hypothetical protein
MADIKGRPRKAIIQEKNIGFYLTWKQYAIVQKKAKEAKLTISDYMRQVALNAKVIERWTPKQQEGARRVIGVAADIHQLMLNSKEMTADELEQMFQKYRDILDEAIEILRHAR